jgi:hypothetical protein
MKEQIPQAWVGQDVILCRVGTESWELVTLREVSELGLTYEYKAGEVEGQPVFVRPPIPEDLQAAEAETG